MGIFLHEADWSQRSSDKAVSDIVDIISLSDNSIISNYTGELALLQSDIFTATRIIAGDIAAASYRVSDNDHISDLLNKRANESATAYNFLFALIANTLLNNQGFALIERDDQGFVTGLRNIKTSQVTVLEGEDGKGLGYKVLIKDKNGSQTDQEIAYEDMIHLKAFSTDGKVGLSPLYSLSPEISMLKNGNNLLASFFKKGINLTGILSVDKASLNNASKKSIRESFEEANSGANNAGSVMILGAGETFKEIEFNTKVLDMIQNNKYSTQQIAKTYGIPLSRFGQELVNSSDSEANDIYITSTLNAYSQMLSQEFEKLGTTVTPDFSVLKGVDAQTLKTEMIKRNSGDGILTINEVREFYGMGSVEGGDEIYKSSQVLPLDKLI